MKKLSLLAAIMACLLLAACANLSPLQTAYMQCKASGAKSVSNGSGASPPLLLGLYTEYNGYNFDCPMVLENKEVKKSLQDKGKLDKNGNVPN
ncbi:MAG: hypothetical protein QM529_03690 [Hydrotalea sp.]|nr:hypothetical protein [Hydrotalea sp.]